MSKYNLKNSPYYDDYDPSKKYSQVLAIPGRVAQARELTQAQSIMKDIIKSIGDSFMKDGDIIEGCQVTVADDKKSVTVSAGKVYIDGFVHDVEEQTVEITGTGTENICVEIDETVITEVEDHTLRDPAIGYDNYNKAGAHRLKSSVKVVVNSETGGLIATLIDGDQQTENYSSEYSILQQTLARRTFDESGSYIVNGLSVSMEAGEDDEHYTAVVDAGKAYVLGYELGIPVPRRISVPRSTDYDLVEAGNYVYLIGTTDYMLDEDMYVKDIVSVSGNVSETQQGSITTGNDRVLLNKQNVLDITRVSSGAVVYVKDTDYSLQRDGTHYYLQWNNVNFPDPGVQFTVIFTYVKTFASTDYTLIQSNGHHYLRFTAPGVASRHPINGTNFNVSYNQYLARKDVVYIDQVGNIDVKQGIPAEYGFESKPNAPINTLELALIMSPPNGSVASTSSTQKMTVTNTGLTRFTMQDIQYMLDRIRTLEYDNATVNLETSAKSEYTENDKRGIIADPFVDFSRCDLTFNLDPNGNIIDSTNVVFAAAISFSDNIAYLPVEEYCSDLVVNTSGTTAVIKGRLAMLGTTGEKVLIDQPRASKSFLINPYDVFPSNPEISINPAVDTWIDTQIVEVPVSMTDSTIIATTTNTIRNRRSSSGWWTEIDRNVTTTEVGATVKTYTTDSVIAESAVTYIRQRTITVTGKNFPPALDNIKGYFDGKLVDLSPASGTSSGTISGTVKSNSAGELTATFTIPNGVRTGTREVKLQSDIIIDGWKNFASTTYQATGILKTIQRTITTVTTVLLTQHIEETITEYYDPLGQSFAFNDDTIVTGVEVFFESKASDNQPVTCEIRKTSNGTITNEVLGYSLLYPSQVNISSNSATATRFNFETPVYCEGGVQYAFVIRSSSIEYRLWVAEMGGTDVLTGGMIMKNAYVTGTMYSSSNNYAWTLHQTTDMKFKVIGANYVEHAVINFQPITGINYGSISLGAETIIPKGTSIDWEYSTDGSTYFPIEPYHQVKFNFIANNLFIRATLRRTSSPLTPIIALDSLNIVGTRFKTEGNYIMKNITNLDPYDEVQVVCETFVPNGTTLKFYCSVDDGNTWLEMSVVESRITNKNYGWTEYTYSRQFGTTYTQCRLRVAMTSTNNYTSPAIRKYRGIMTKVVH